ncbi:restriction endonuclease subunit S [Leptolyngbyaceae cyanobacterium UHCC 1019]
MSFQLSPDVDDNKIFLVNLSEVNERLDPNFIKKSRLLKSILANSQFSFQEFGNYIKNIQYGISQISNTEQKGIPMIRMNNLQGDEWNFLDLKNIELTSEEINLYRLNKGDLLFNRTNSKELVGKCGVFREEGDWVFASYLIRVQVDETRLLPDFVSTFLRLSVGRLQIDGLSRQIIGMTNINAEEIRSLQIPSVPLSLQKQTVFRMDAAYDAKKQKEAEAQRLLDSIDDYLLSKLGINLQEPEENTIQNRVFFCNLRSVVGRRFDPLYHSGNIYKFIESSSYSFEYISRLTVYMKTGFASGKQDQSNDEQDVIQIRSTNISDEREFIFTRNVYIRKSELLNRKNDVLQIGEVLFNNTNSQELVGKSIFFDLDDSYFCSNHTTRIGVQQDRVDPQYLTHILNLYQRKQVFFKICTNWNNQSGVNVNVLGQVKVPIPPLEKQIEIVDRITTIRNQAKQLRQAAAAELERAKQEVEAMILGES